MKVAVLKCGEIDMPVIVASEDNQICGGVRERAKEAQATGAVAPSFIYNISIAPDITAVMCPASSYGVNLKSLQHWSPKSGARSPVAIMTLKHNSQAH